MKQERDRCLQAGIALFNDKKFYEAHEAWEAWWLKDKSGEREVFQGLILLAAALHHCSKGKPAAGQKAFVKARVRLRSFKGEFKGLDLEALIDHAEQMLTHY